MKTFIAIVGVALLSLLLLGNANPLYAGSPNPSSEDFLGEKGQELIPIKGIISIDEEAFQNERVRFFHVFLSPKKPIYFLIVRNDSTYQILANACRFCFQAKSGFYVEGDHIICRVCETPYRIEEVATIQEGCSPLPIKTNLVAKEGKISFSKKILEKFISYF